MFFSDYSTLAETTRWLEAMVIAYKMSLICLWASCLKPQPLLDENRWLLFNRVVYCWGKVCISWRHHYVWRSCKSDWGMHHTCFSYGYYLCMLRTVLPFSFEIRSELAIYLSRCQGNIISRTYFVLFVLSYCIFFFLTWSLLNPFPVKV